MLGLRFLRLDGGLPPELCGFGSLKVNSKVPPIVRVCGATWGSGYLFFVPLEGVYYSDSRGDEVSYIAGDHCQVVA